MANQNTTTERTNLQTKRFSKDEAAALRKNHVSRPSTSISGLQLVSDLRRSEEVRDCEAHPRRLSCQLVRCDQYERRRPTHAHDWLKDLRQRGVRKRRRTPTDIPPSGYRRWTQGLLGNARFRRPSSRADAILLRIDSRGAANGRFLRHRPERSERCVNY